MGYIQMLLEMDKECWDEGCSSEVKRYTGRESKVLLDTTTFV